MATYVHSDTVADNVVRYTYEDNTLLGVLLLSGSSTDITIPTVEGEFTITEIGPFAFTEESGITGLTLANSITTIRNKAFFNCKTLKNLTIGTGLAVLEEYAFAGCNNLESITGNGSGITAINNVLYSGSRAILGTNGNITWRQDQTRVTEIGNRAFSFCDRITSLTIPATVTKIGDYAFSDCSAITSLTIPESAVSIGYGAFFGCGSVERVVISEGVKRLAGLGFAAEENLIVVQLPNSLESIGAVIGEETFSNAGRDILFDVPEGWEEEHGAIKDLLLGQFTQLKSIIPVKFFKPPELETPFSDTPVPNLAPIAVAIGNAEDKWAQEYPDEQVQGYYYHYDAETEKYSGKASGTDLAMNYTRVGRHAIGIDEILLYAAYKVIIDLDKIFYVKITDEPTAQRPYGKVTLTGVKDWERLASTGYKIPATMENGGVEYRVTVLGPNLFAGGTLASTIDVPWTVTRINKGAFKGHKELEKVRFPDYEPEGGGSKKKSQLKTIDGQAFAGTGLTEFKVPGALETVKQGAFADCGSLDAVYADTMEHWLKLDFGDSACNPLCNGGTFYVGTSEVTGLYSGNLDTATEIKPYAFAGCGSIVSVDLSDTRVNTIGAEAFTANANLTSLTISGGVAAIGRAAFSNTGLTEVAVPYNENAEIDGIGEFMFNGCAALETVTVDSKIVSNSMFSNCPALTTVEIGEHVKAIGKSAFAGSGNAYVRNTEDSQTGNWYYKLYGMKVTFKENGRCAIIDDYAFAKSGVVSADAEATGEDEDNPKGDVLALPSTLQRIGVSGFNGCGGLYKLALPDSLQSIGEHAFDNCRNLHKDNYYGYIALDGWILGTGG